MKKGTNKRSSQEGENKNIHCGEKRFYIELYKTILGPGLGLYKFCNNFNNFELLVNKTTNNQIKKNKQTSSVYDCTVKDVEYICNILRC